MLNSQPQNICYAKDSRLGKYETLRLKMGDISIDVLGNLEYLVFLDCSGSAQVVHTSLLEANTPAFTENDAKTLQGNMCHSQPLSRSTFTFL